jgi:hypothetical protein
MKRSIGFIILVVIAGALIGSALGEIIASVIPAGMVKQFFLKSISASFGPAVLNMVIFTITLGLSIKINITAVIGMILAAYLLRKMD